MKLIAWTDGASRGNPGPAAIGYIIRTADGAEVERQGRTIGIATNNVAEYTACIEALEHMCSLGATEIELRADSELLVKQLNGAYKVRNSGLIPLYRRVKILLESFDTCKVLHIPREQNREADHQGNLALDGKPTGGSERGRGGACGTGGACHTR
jgi:ribonuclease HI